MGQIIESMTRVSLSGGRVVRVWREETKLKSVYENNDVTLAIISNSQLPQDKLAEHVCKLDRVNAVEVVDYKGDGVVYYPSWP
jgi:hypothetical protein